MDNDAKTLDPRYIADILYSAISECATTLRSDYACSINDILCEMARDARCSEKDAYGENLESRSLDVLQSIMENSEIGKRDHTPICQDTGSVWVCLEVGKKHLVHSDIFSMADDAIERAYKDNHLRMSIVKDALFDRANTNNNTPGFYELKFTGDDVSRMHVLLKGGGSDNASRLVMLPPSAGKEGVIDVVLDCVREKAANACPPLVIGLGVGSTFDKVAGLAKHALLREIGSEAETDESARFEREVLDAVNATGIGAGALGGGHTALAVHLETAPCHIAALPVAVNMGCCAMRSKTIVIE